MILSWHNNCNLFVNFSFPLHMDNTYCHLCMTSWSLIVFKKYFFKIMKYLLQNFAKTTCIVILNNANLPYSMLLILKSWVSIRKLQEGLRNMFTVNHHVDFQLVYSLALRLLYKTLSYFVWSFVRYVIVCGILV